MDIKSYISASIETKQKILDDKTILDTIQKISDKIVETYKNGGKVLTAGNGGSAGDAQHIAGELVSKFFFDRPALCAFALSANTSVLTSIGNDYGYECSFSRQIEAQAKKGDVFIAISTSGNSQNIVKALETARKIGVITVGLVGEKECKTDRLCDFLIKVPSSVTPTIQESHIMIGHIICGIVEEKMFK